MTTFLETLDPDLRNAILKIGDLVRFEAGQAVFNRGDPGVALYVVEEGTATVHDGDLVLNMLGPGDVFGEIAGLGGMERTASVTAEEDLAVLRVESEALYSAVQGHTGALQGLVRMLCEREGGMANRMTNRSWELHAAKQEMEIGRRIQAGFLPNVLPDVPGYDIAGHFQAARVVAGDFYDAFYIPAINRLALVMGDVCDKGVGAALFMTLFRSLIRATAQSRTFVTWAVDDAPGRTKPPCGDDCASLAKETLANTVALTNNYVATTHGSTSMFASVFVGLIEPATGEMDYVNAGHEEAYILGPNGLRTALQPMGPVLGIFAGAGHDIGSERIAPGETLLLYTDGVPEATSENGKQFSEHRLQSLLDSPPENAQLLLEKIVTSVGEFTQGADQHDDITILATCRQTY